MGLFDFLGFGGGSGPSATPTSQTTTTGSLPSYAKPYYTDIMERAQGTMDETYQPYPEERLAGFGTETEAGYGALTDIAKTGTPQAFTAAEAALTGQVDPAAAGMGVEQQALYSGVGSFADPDTASRYMNPYVTNVLDAQHARLSQRFDENQLLRDDQAVQAGAFSNTRRGVQDAIAQRELDMQRNELDAMGLSAAYQTGADIFGTEQERELQGRNIDAEIFAANQNRILEQNKNIMAAAGGLSEQSLADYNLATDKARMQAGIGGVYDEQTQAQLDIGYADFLNQRDFDKSQLNYYSGIMRGIPTAPQQETTTYTAPPSTASQLLGLGIGGLGLYQAMS